MAGWHDCSGLLLPRFGGCGPVIGQPRVCSRLAPESENKKLLQTIVSL